MDGARSPPVAQRVDKWLVVARFCKTRVAARDLLASGHVRVDGRVVKQPDRAIRPGAVLTLALPHATLVVRMRNVAERRGPPAQARQLYEVIDPATS